MEQPATFDPEVLAAHAGFVHRLAWDLTRGADASRVQDLAADTMAAALEQRPQTGTAFRGWLRRVVSRIARRRRTSEWHRAAREHAVARSEQEPSAAEIAARIELERLVAAAFARLDEPYRSTLFRRYWLDRAPAEIAADTATPVATVKSRLQRGLEQIRDRLDAAHSGTREAWLAALLPWFAYGGPVVTTKSKVVPIAAAAVTVLAVGVAVVEPWNQGSDSHAGDEPPAHARLQPRASEVATQETSKVTPERTPAALAADPDLLPFAAGSVVDSTGAPIAGVAVVASRIVRSRDPNEPSQQWAFEYESIARDTLARTDSSGRFAIAAPVDDLITLWFVKPGYGLGQWFELSEQRSANQHVRVVLAPAVPMRGTVLDSEGRPIPRADVGIGVVLDPGQELARRVARNLPGAPEYTAAPAIGWQRGKADDAGRFDLGCVPAGRFTAGASADGYNSAAVVSDALPDPWNPVLARSDLLIEVVDADTGRPIEHASAVLLARSSGKVLATAYSTIDGFGDSARRVGERLNVPLGFGEGVANQRGFLVMQEPPWLTNAPGGVIDLEIRCLADGYVGDFVDVTLSRRTEPPHLRVELVPDDGDPGEVSLAGRVVGAKGVDVRLYLFAPGWSPVSLLHGPPLLTAKCDADGEFAFHELPVARYLLFASQRGFSPASVEVEAPASGVVLELRTSAALEVRVTDGTGRPVPGAVVHAEDDAGKEARTRVTDEEGVARFDAMPEGPARAIAFLVPDAPSYASSDRASPLGRGRFAPEDVVELRAGETASLEIALLERLPVRLRFVHDDGTPVSRVALDWSGMESDSPAGAIGPEFERLRTLAVELDSRGEATVELYPGRYHYVASEAAVRRRITIDVPRGASEVTATIRLPDRRPSGKVRGSVVDLVTGSPLGYRGVRAVGFGSGDERIDLGTVRTDFQGLFEIADVPEGGVELIVEADRSDTDQRPSRTDPGSPYGIARLRATVAADRETVVEFAIPPAKLFLTMPERARELGMPTSELHALVTDASTGRPIAGATIEAYALVPEGDYFAGLATTGADGRARGDLFAAEKYRLEVSTPWTFETSPPTPPKYRSAHHEAATIDGIVTIEVELAPRG